MTQLHLIIFVIIFCYTMYIIMSSKMCLHILFMSQHVYCHITDIPIILAKKSVGLTLYNCYTNVLCLLGPLGPKGYCRLLRAPPPSPPPPLPHALFWLLHQHGATDYIHNSCKHSTPPGTFFTQGQGHMSKFNGQGQRF